MKTNHRRGFVAKPHKDQAMFSASAIASVADKGLHVYIGNDFTKGNRGMAKAKREAKKFLHSRARFHDNTATRRLASEQAD